MACCPCSSSSNCTCGVDCAQCGSCITTFSWKVILSGFTGGTDCVNFNRTWILCQTATACQWKATSGNDIVQLDFISASSLWQLKVSSDNGAHFAFFTLAAASFGCTITNVLNFDHQDAGFPCGGVPATVTLTPTAVCCEANLPNHCCCLEYPGSPIATLKSVSGCNCLDGATVQLFQLNPGCDNPDLLAGSTSFPGCSPALCVAIRVNCNADIQGACGMILSGLVFCTDGNCSFDGFCSAPQTCDGSGGADLACGGVTPCPAASCSCNPFLLTFNNVSVATTGLCGDSCAGVYNVIITD